MRLELPATIHSQAQVEGLILHLQEFLKVIRAQAAKTAIKSARPTKITEQLDPELAEIAAAWHGSAEITPASLEELSQQLRHLIQTAPVIHLTLAAVPGETLKEQFTLWFRRNVRPDILIEFGFSRSLAGGMVLRTTNRIIDMSFRSQLLSKRQSLPALIQAATAGQHV